MRLTPLFTAALVYAFGGAPLAPDESVIFYPTVAPEFFARVVETEHDSVTRNWFLDGLADSLDLEDMTRSESELFRERGMLFLADGESGKELHVVDGEENYALDKSGSGGYLRSVLRVKGKPEPGWQEVSTVSGERRFLNYVLHLAPEGVSVVSDIDDTIKETNVLNFKEMLRNTFLRPFRAVEGMPELYQAWEKAGARFHYVSGGPWQLWPVLEQFFDKVEFPRGSAHLRIMRLAPGNVTDLFKSPELHKLTAIRKLLEDFPKRTFVLVGDSGERDPEVYAKILEDFPAQIRVVYIRDVTGEARSAPRYKELFGDNPKMIVFKSGGELPRKIK